ncbi:MAG TPA: fatty acid desaturase [Candidatus Binatia bacterium]
MDENLETTSRLSRDEMKRLLVRRDGPGLVRFSLQLAAFILVSLLTLRLAAAGSPLRLVAAAVDGVLLLTFFASMHEAGHGTAFASQPLARAVTWVSAVLMLQSPAFFREFHFEHHRRTSEPDGDPEISGAPSVLGPWPSNPVLYAAVASGQHLMVGKAFFTLVAALLPREELVGRFFPYVRPPLRRRVVVESRIASALWIAAAWYGLARVPGFGTLLLAWPVAHVALGLFVMPEHTGLATSGSQIHRTRSMRSNALVHWAMWNMSWHAEHHAFPAVPFHALAELHSRIDADLENTIDGYVAFHAEALRRSLGRSGARGQRAA